MEIFFLCEIIVEDNGIGFDEVYKEKIFELFQWFNFWEMYEGMGVGFVIVKKIVENYYGEIDVFS